MVDFPASHISFRGVAINSSHVLLPKNAHRWRLKSCGKSWSSRLAPSQEYPPRWASPSDFFNHIKASCETNVKNQRFKLLFRKKNLRSAHVGISKLQLNFLEMALPQTDFDLNDFNSCHCGKVPTWQCKNPAFPHMMFLAFPMFHTVWYRLLVYPFATRNLQLLTLSSSQ